MHTSGNRHGPLNVWQIAVNCLEGGNCHAKQARLPCRHNKPQSLAQASRTTRHGEEHHTTGSATEPLETGLPSRLTSASWALLWRQMSTAKAALNPMISNAK